MYFSCVLIYLPGVQLCMNRSVQEYSSYHCVFLFLRFEAAPLLFCLHYWVSHRPETSQAAMFTVSHYLVKQK